MKRTRGTTARSIFRRAPLVALAILGLLEPSRAQPAVDPLSACAPRRTAYEARYIVFFDAGSAVLGTRDRAIPDALIAEQRGTTVPVIEMDAQTDRFEAKPNAQALRTACGAAVRACLTERGISPQWLFVGDSGLGRSPFPSAIPEPQNRRVALWPRAGVGAVVQDRRAACKAAIKRVCLSDHAAPDRAACTAAIDGL